ncbi:MAG: tail fiber domain-containing protein [Leifsonia sp.]
MPYSPPPGNGYDQLVKRIEDLEQALRTALRPTGTSVGSLVARVDQTLANIDTTVQTSIQANSYTRSQIDAKDVAAGQAWLAGGTASGAISASDLFTRNGPNQNITATRVAGWIRSSDGLVGTASSSERFKTNIADAGLIEKAEAILGIQLVYYNYKAEVAKRDDPTSPDYVGPDYQVHQELGVIAERLHEAGLWEFVVYERDPQYETRTREVTVVETDEDGELHVVTREEEYQAFVGEVLRRDADGNPIPYGVHYEMFGMAAIAAAQYLYRLFTAQQQQLDQHTAAITAITSHLGL